MYKECIQNLACMVRDISLIHQRYHAKDIDSEWLADNLTLLSVHKTGEALELTLNYNVVASAKNSRELQKLTIANWNQDNTDKG